MARGPLPGEHELQLRIFYHELVTWPPVLSSMHARSTLESPSALAYLWHPLKVYSEGLRQ